MHRACVEEAGHGVVEASPERAPRAEVRPHGEMLFTCGIDVGASAIKVAVIGSHAGGGRRREDARLLGHCLERIRRRDPRQVVRKAFDDALRRAGVGEADLVYVATTGEGDLVPFRTGHFYSMTAHSRGALFLEPGCRAILDVGSLHARAVRIDPESRVLDYRMTSQCASGSGQFLENISRYLGVTLDEVGSLSRQARKPEKVSSICAVLAETDVINMVSREIPVGDILRGIHESMAGRYVRLLLGVDASEVVLVTGGLAVDTGLVGCIRESLATSRPGLDVRTHPLSVQAGAIGAALWGAYRHEVLRDRAGGPARRDAA